MKRTEAYLKMKSGQKQSKKACFRRLLNLQSENESTNRSSDKSEEVEFVCDVKQKNVTTATAKTEMLTLRTSNFKTTTFA